MNNISPLSELFELLSKLDRSILETRKSFSSSMAKAEDPKDAQDQNLSMFKVDAPVKWGKNTGKVVQMYRRKITKRIKNEDITLTGTPENPALLIQTNNGDLVFKSSTEVTLA